MELTQDCPSRTRQRPNLFLEYLIDCPPCPREKRTHGWMIHGPRRRAASSSTADEPQPRRSLPATPTAESTGPGLLDNDDDRQRSTTTQFQRRMSPFRRGYHERLRRPASVTPTLSEEDSVDYVRRHQRPVQDDAAATGDGRKTCSLQQMIRHRRSSSNSSNTSLPEHNQHQQPDQVKTSSQFHEVCHHHHHHHLALMTPLICSSVPVCRPAQLYS